VAEQAVASSAALRSAGDRLNRRPKEGRSKDEARRRRRASSHAGFGAVGGPRDNSTHRRATASSVLKASETRTQRLQRLLAQLGQQRARVGAELEAQRNYLLSISDDLKRGRRDAREVQKLRELQEESEGEAARLGSLLGSLHAEYQAVATEVALASPPRVQIEPSPRRHTLDNNEAAGGGRSLPFTAPAARRLPGSLAVGAAPGGDHAGEPQLSAWGSEPEQQGGLSPAGRERNELQREFQAVQRARAAEQAATRARLAQLRQ
jgi:hypothetical protein